MVVDFVRLTAQKEINKNFEDVKNIVLNSQELLKQGIYLFEELKKENNNKSININAGLLYVLGLIVGEKNAKKFPNSDGNRRGEQRKYENK